MYLRHGKLELYKLEDEDCEQPKCEQTYRIVAKNANNKTNM